MKSSKVGVYPVLTHRVTVGGAGPTGARWVQEVRQMLVDFEQNIFTRLIHNKTFLSTRMRIHCQGWDDGRGGNRTPS